MLRLLWIHKADINHLPVIWHFVILTRCYKIKNSFYRISTVRFHQKSCDVGVASVNVNYINVRRIPTVRVLGKFSWKNREVGRFYVGKSNRRFESCHAVTFPTSFRTFQFKLKLTNKKLFNIKLSNFSIFQLNVSFINVRIYGQLLRLLSKA